MRTIQWLLLLVIAPIVNVESGFLPLFNNFMLFPRIRCLLAFLRLNFDIASFDKYNDYFRNDSVIVLAQTGEYVGAERIEEYVKFVFAEFSPYFGYGGDGKNKSSYLQYKDGKCEYIATYYNNYTADVAASPNLPATFGGTAMIKIFLDYRRRYIPRMNVFYADDFARIVFNVMLNAAETRRYVCGVMEGPCSTILNMSAGGSCDAMLNTLPTTTGNDGTSDEVNYYVDGNSQGCRALHAVFANINPMNHCPHLSFAPMKDPSGKIKCQTSNFAKPSDLFTPNDLERFESFTESVGVDPNLGHTLVDY